MTAKNEFIKEEGGDLSVIYRLKVPFEDLYTSVFLVRSGEENSLVDCATTAADVDDVIEPALGALGVSFSDITRVIITHDHGDHSGGLSRVLQKLPSVKVIKREQIVNGLEIYPLPGHTKDFIGVFCFDSGTLISGDGLQGYGVGRYPCSLQSKEGYLKSIEKIEKNKSIKNLLFSHAYEPWLNDRAFGRENVEKVLKDCKDYVFRSYKD